jgi:DNA-binding transcriptional MerR regulator
MLTESLREPWKAWKEQQQLDQHQQQLDQHQQQLDQHQQQLDQHQQQLDQHQHPSTDIYAAPLRVLPGNTFSDGTLDLIEHWLAGYLCNHSACVAARVNDREEILHGVRFLQITDPHTILLREDMVPYQYTCLTHCWGGSEIIPKTTVANKAIHIERGLSVGSLPETFRETVHVCHRIDIDFVWIDSLCIVQDGDWDWRSQAARISRFLPDFPQD